MDLFQTMAAVGSGVIVGFTLGLVGGGGSVLAVPLLLYVVGMPDPHQAIGTSALAVAVNAFANLVPHARAQHVRWRPALIFAAAGLVGAFIGSSIGKVVDGRRLLILFALLMLVIAVMMLRGRKADASAAGAGPAGAPLAAQGDRTRRWHAGRILWDWRRVPRGARTDPRDRHADDCRDRVLAGRGRGFRNDDGGELCRLRTRRMADRSAVHRGRDRRRMDRRASREIALGAAADADARAGVHAGRGGGLHAVSEPDVVARTVRPAEVLTT